MKPESIVLGVAGTFFGLLVGWIIGAQQMPSLRSQATAVPAGAAQTTQSAPSAAVRPPLDDAQVQALRAIADRDANNAQSRVQLGNLYLDAERYTDSIRWYEEALKLLPKDVNLSTDLAVSYYYTEQTDKALSQFDYSLKIDPKHTKTLLNQGIVKAFGKQDLPGAMAAWEAVLKIAPDSQEANAARRALENLKAAHPGGTPTPPPGTPPAGTPTPAPGRAGD